MDEETNGFWMVALGGATASGTWAGFSISPLRHTASLRVDGALTVKDDDPRARDYALVLSHPDLEGDRVLVAGKGGTVEFGHDLVEVYARTAAAGRCCGSPISAPASAANAASSAGTARPRPSAAGRGGRRRHHHRQHHHRLTRHRFRRPRAGPSGGEPK